MNKQVNNGNCQYHVTPTYVPGTGEGPFYSPVFTPYSLYGHLTYGYPTNSYYAQRLNNIDPITIASSNNFANVEENVRITAKGAPSRQLLTPTNHLLILTDHQPQMAFATKSLNIAELRNNIEGLAKAAKLFRVPTILTTIAAATFSGKIFEEIQAVFPDQKPIDRTTMNAWENRQVIKQVNAYGKGKIVMAGLWTEVCLAEPVLSAIEEGYTVYFVSDASGGVSEETHAMAVTRMVQAGAIPLTWLQYLLELQSDWARQETYNGTLTIVKEHGGAYGLGVLYADQMFGSQDGMR